jgi:hypothetical protein
MTLRDAINSAIDEEMERDSRVFLIGELESRRPSLHLSALLLFAQGRITPHRRSARVLASNSLCRRGGGSVPGCIQGACQKSKSACVFELLHQRQ